MWVGGVAAALLAAGVVVAQDVPRAASPPEAPKAVAKKDKPGWAEKEKPGRSEKAAVATRESVITSAKIEFDNKEGVILFDENVVVDDAQFLMSSDRLLVFMEGTNEVRQIMAVGHVNITNENRTASCDKAVYTKLDGRIVMTGNAHLKQQGKEMGDVTGEQITIWVDDERMVVTPGRVVLPPGSFNKGERKVLP